jgi:hypothetical protein
MPLPRWHAGEASKRSAIHGISRHAWRHRQGELPAGARGAVERPAPAASALRTPKLIATTLTPRSTRQQRAAQ